MQCGICDPSICNREKPEIVNICIKSNSIELTEDCFCSSNEEDGKDVNCCKNEFCLTNGICSSDRLCMNWFWPPNGKQFCDSHDDCMENYICTGRMSKYCNCAGQCSTEYQSYCVGNNFFCLTILKFYFFPLKDLHSFKWSPKYIFQYLCVFFFCCCCSAKLYRTCEVYSHPSNSKHMNPFHTASELAKTIFHKYPPQMPFFL